VGDQHRILKELARAQARLAVSARPRPILGQKAQTHHVPEGAQFFYVITKPGFLAKTERQVKPPDRFVVGQDFTPQLVQAKIIKHMV
jgi:hypothetical protein